MRAPSPPGLLARLAPVFLVACTGGPDRGTQLQDALAEAPPHSEARLWLDGDHIVAAAAPIGAELLPPLVRTALQATAPDGELAFVGREWGPRGAGFRIEKAYAQPMHRRSVLLAPDGTVLERAHTLPVAEVPPDVLATGARHGSRVDEAWIVSGPAREEHWTLVMRDRFGTAHVLQVGLDGKQLRLGRRVAARVDS